MDGSEDTQGPYSYSQLSAEALYQKLRDATMTEMNCPELLPYKADVTVHFIEELTKVRIHVLSYLIS